MEVYSGVLPKLHAQSECRCPPSHPRVHPLVERYSIMYAYVMGDCIFKYFSIINIFVCWWTCLLSCPFIATIQKLQKKKKASILTFLFNLTANILKTFNFPFYRYCIPSGVEDITNDRVLRLNLNAHPLSYINDQDLGTTWLSKIMTTQELDEGVTITVDLANGQYQVIHL